MIKGSNSANQSDNCILYFQLSKFRSEKMVNVFSSIAFFGGEILKTFVYEPDLLVKS